MGSTPLLRPLQQQPLAELGPQGSGVQLRSTPAAVPGHCRETRWILPTQDALQPWTVTPPSSVPAQDPPEGHPRVQGAHGRECQVHQRFPPPRRSPEAQGHSLRGPLPKARPAKSTLLARWGDRVSRGRGWLTFMFCSSHTMNHPSWCQPVYF